MIGFVLSSSVESPLGGLATSNGLRPGLAMAAKQLADELGPDGIRVFGLAPGRISTDRTRQLDERSPGRREAGEAAIPLRRYREPRRRSSPGWPFSGSRPPRRDLDFDRALSSVARRVRKVVVREPAPPARVSR